MQDSSYMRKDWLMEMLHKLLEIFNVTPDKPTFFSIIEINDYLIVNFRKLRLNILIVMNCNFE